MCVNKVICEKEKDIMYDICGDHVKGQAELCASVYACSVSSEFSSVWGAVCLSGQQKRASRN